MAKKENKKPALKQGWDIQSGTRINKGKPTPGTNTTYKESYGAAGGGKYGNPGDQNTGYSIDWSQVDYGKSTMENIMKNKEDYDSGIKEKPEKETKEEVVYGCTNPTADNYDATATVDDGSCIMPEKEEEEEEVNEEVVNEEVVNEEVVDEEKKEEEIVKKEEAKLGTNTGGERNSANINFSGTVNKEDQKTLKEAEKKMNTNKNPNVDGVKNKNSVYSNELGGGDFKKKTVRSSFDKNGNLKDYKSKGTDSRGNKWDYGFKMSKDKSGLKTIKFNNLSSTPRYIFKQFGLPTNGTLSAKQYSQFREKYTVALKEARELLKKNAGSGLTDFKLVKSLTKTQRRVLQMDARGFFNGSMGDAPTQFRSPMKDRIRGWDETGHNQAHDDYDKGEGADPHAEKEPAPTRFRSPFARRDRTSKNLRQNWMPQQTPMNYGSPLHQEQPSAEPQQFKDIWEKVRAYGTDMPEKIDKFIKHVRYNPEVDLPINSFQNQEWTGIVTKWLQGQKASMVKARNNKDNDAQQKIAASVNVLIQDITTYSGKFEDWIARNSGDAAEGNAGGSVVSEGSKKDERFIGNITFMGDKNTTIAVGEDGKVGIKSYGLDNVKYIEELDNDVFAKDDVGYAQFLKISEELQKNAEQGKPLNENVVKGSADQLLKNKDSILSWAFDPLYGQSWLQDFAQGNPNANVDIFMPESPSFDIDYLTDEIHGWLSAKLTEAYEKNVPKQPEKPGGAAQGIMDQTLAGVEEEKKNKEGVYAEGGEQPQGPPQGPPQAGAMAQGPPQGSPMAYKGKMSKKALSILRKYNRI